MRANNLLICGVTAVFTYGVIYDVLADGNWIKGDGHDHTTPRVPAGLAVAGSGVATTTQTTHAMATAFYVPNNVTGEDCRVPPLDHREYAAATIDG
jgi:hypothetical protein